MRLTTFTDYSLRVLMYLAARPGGRGTIGEIAKAYSISHYHLVKVAQRLGHEGFLDNTRGRGGGLRLALAPDQINVGRVVRAVEGADATVECFDESSNQCALSGSCRLESVFAEATRSFHDTLSRYTLADLVANREPIARVLHFQPAAMTAAESV